MSWIIFVAVGLFVIASVVNIATTVRDKLQIILANRRKLKSSGSRAGNRFLLILLLPITLYLILGTLLLLLLCVMEMGSKKLRHYAGAGHVEVIPWHEVSLFLTLLFPLTWPVVASIVGLVFAGAVFSAVVTLARKVIDAMLRLVRRIWINIVHTLRTLVEWLIDRLRLVWETIVVGTQTIWEMVVAGTQTVWELVVGKIQQVFEQLTTLMHEIWATINAKIRV
jgi:hypothetical protein